jgi:hypothetical protein
MYLAVEKHKIIVINIVNFNSVIIDAVIIIIKVLISLVESLWIWKERKQLVNKFKRFFWFIKCNSFEDIGL